MVDAWSEILKNLAPTSPSDPMGTQAIDSMFCQVCKQGMSPLEPMCRNCGTPNPMFKARNVMGDGNVHTAGQQSMIERARQAMEAQKEVRTPSAEERGRGLMTAEEFHQTPLFRERQAELEEMVAHTMNEVRQGRLPYSTLYQLPEDVVERVHLKQRGVIPGGFPFDDPLE